MDIGTMKITTGKLITFLFSVFIIKSTVAQNERSGLLYRRFNTNDSSLYANYVCYSGYNQRLSVQQIKKLDRLDITLDTLPDPLFFHQLDYAKHLSQVDIYYAGPINSPNFITSELFHKLAKNKKISSLSILLSGSNFFDEKTGTYFPRGGFYLPKEIEKFSNVTDLYIADTENNRTTILKNLDDTIYMPHKLINLSIKPLTSNSPYIDLSKCTQLKTLDIATIPSSKQNLTYQRSFNIPTLKNITYEYLVPQENYDSIIPASFSFYNINYLTFNRTLENMLSIYSYPGLYTGPYPGLIDTFQIKNKLDVPYDFYINVSLAKKSHTELSGYFDFKTNSSGKSLLKLSGGNFQSANKSLDVFEFTSNADTCMFVSEFLPTMDAMRYFTTMRFEFGENSRVVTGSILADSIDYIAIADCGQETQYTFSKWPKKIKHVYFGNFKVPFAPDPNSLLSFLNSLKKSQVSGLTLPITAVETIYSNPDLLINCQHVRFILGSGSSSYFKEVKDSIDRYNRKNPGYELNTSRIVTLLNELHTKYPKKFAKLD